MRKNWTGTLSELTQAFVEGIGAHHQPRRGLNRPAPDATVTADLSERRSEDVKSGDAVPE